MRMSNRVVVQVYLPLPLGEGRGEGLGRQARKFTGL